MKVLGIVDLIWKGKNLQIDTKTAKLRLGGIKNNAVVVGRRTARAQEYQGSQITAKVSLGEGQSWGDIWDEGEGELQALCDTGQTYIFPDAFLVDDIPEISSGAGGDIELKWAASDYEEIIAS